MQFHRHDSPPPYLNARDQRRLLLMVGLLAVVIIGIEFVAQPSTWYWLTGPPQSETNRAPQRPVTEPISDALDDPTRLDPRILESVQDNSLGVRSSERDAYFQILASARDFSEAVLQAHASREVTFAQIFGDPDHYRGRLITMTGRVKQLLPITAIQNEFGVTTIYEAWIITADSGDNPVLLHLTEIPDGIPTGEGLDLSCQFTGYFFKKYAYAALHGLHSTTIFLGKGLRWTPPPPSRGLGLAPYILGIVVVMGSVLAFVLWRYTVSDRRFRKAHWDRMANVDLTDFSDDAVLPDGDGG